MIVKDQIVMFVLIQIVGRAEQLRKYHTTFASLHGARRKRYLP